MRISSLVFPRPLFRMPSGLDKVLYYAAFLEHNIKHHKSDLFWHIYCLTFFNNLEPSSQALGVYVIVLSRDSISGGTEMIFYDSFASNHVFLEFSFHVLSLLPYFD